MKHRSKHAKSLVIAIALLALLGMLAITTALAADTAAPEAPEADPTMPPPILEFNGLDREDFDAGGTDPETIIPDTTGAAGHTHYLQAVNKAIAIYTKGGTLIDSQTFETFWTPATTGTACDGGSDFHHGQPYLMYDHLAGRWVVVDVAYDPTLVGTDLEEYYLCMAVSNSLMAPMAPAPYFDASYWYYYAVRTIEFNEDFYPDSPKMGLWPDGYYLAVDLYDLEENGLLNSPRGAKVYAFNRSDLTNGVTGFRSVDFYLTESKGYEHLVPSNLLGSPPSSGTPNYFAAIQQGAMHVWEFTTDWSNPNYSTFGITRNSIPNEPNFTLSTDYYDWPIGPIIPQLDVIQRLPVLGDRLMSPLQYRILGGIPSLWATHTVEETDGQIGLRWYEMQFFDSNNLDFVQKGTYEPETDSHARWLGSLATDRTGNMALGFSISSSAMHPAIKYVGRLRTDPFDTLPQGEVYFNMISNTATPYYIGSQDDGDTDPFNGGWGRQSQMSVDPMDECVFWYTNMYYDDDPASMMWRTRIGWFSFPECTGGETTRISISTEGWEGNLHSGLDRDIYEMYQVAVSATGRYVAFSSEATNLVSGDTNGHRDIFLRDRDTDNDGDFDEPGAVSTTRISMGYDGSQANNDSWEVSISYNGRYIAYSSDADNLVTGDGNGSRDVFRYDTVTGTTIRVSVRNGTLNQDANNASDHPAISGNGYYVAFRSGASNLIGVDGNNADDIFVRQINNNTTSRVSVGPAALEADGDSFNPTMSETGQFVAYASDATNLLGVGGDTNAASDVFVYDRNTGITTRVSVATSTAEADDRSYTPFISGNGNFVVFASEATNLDEITVDTNLLADIFVHDIALAETTRVSLSFFGTESDGNSYTPSISREGRYITFASEATNLDVTQSNSNGRRNIYLHDRQLAMDGIYAFGLTSRISLATDGSLPNDWSYAPMVAPYGRHVAYVSEATDLVDNDKNLHWDVFAYDSQRTIPIFLRIPSSVPGSTGEIVTVPVIFSGNNSNIDSTNFSIDFDEECLSFDSSDPNAIEFMLNSSNFYTGATYNPTETSSEIDVTIYSFTDPRVAIPDGVIMTIDLRIKATCAAPPGTSRSARVGFSNDPQPSFGNSGVSISGWALDGFVRILPGQLGDCNGDNIVDAGDLSALVLEIFDGDGMLPNDTPNVNPVTNLFAGNAVGCNPNQDYVVDAGDISCTVNIIFGDTGCTGVSAMQGELMQIELSAPANNSSQLP